MAFAKFTKADSGSQKEGPTDGVTADLPVDIALDSDFVRLVVLRIHVAWGTNNLTDASNNGRGGSREHEPRRKSLASRGQESEVTEVAQHSSLLP